MAEDDKNTYDKVMKEEEKGCSGEVLKTIFILSIIYYLFVYEDRRTLEKRRKGAAVYKPPTYQNTFNFHDLAFTSNFESGNLKFVKKIEPGNYSLFIGEDTNKETRFNAKNWFYFKVTNKQESKSFDFFIQNLSYNWSMWKNGIGIVCKKDKEGSRWRFISPPLELRLKSHFLQVKFNFFLKKGEGVFFALSFPWSYTQDQTYFNRLEKRILARYPKSIYFKKEVLTLSNYGRKIEMITLTHRSNCKKAKGHILDKSNELFNRNGRSESLFFPGKNYIVISARVHPSEVASSFVLQGIIKKLISKRVRRSKFFKESVFVIIPMLNPDGVANGYTRLDTNGFNLNAHYKYANHRTPSIKALINLVRFIDRRGNLYAYIDLHSHITKRGIFFFGNPLKKNNYKSVLEIPYLFDIHQKDFNLNISRFGVDKGESTSRKMFYRITKKNRLFVLETNYWGGKVPKWKLKKAKSVNHNLRKVDSFKKFYTVRKFKEIGRNLAKTFEYSFRVNEMRKSRDNSEEFKKIIKGIEKYYRSMSLRRLKRKKKKKSRGRKKKKRRKRKKKSPEEPN